MSEFFSKLQSGISRATFEADKAIRVSAARSQLSGLEKRLEACYREAGRKLHQLYSAGEIDHEQLTEICSRVAEQLQLISDKEAEIETIKAEVFVATMPSVAQAGTSLGRQAESAARARVGAQTLVTSTTVSGSSSDLDREAKPCSSCDASAPVEAVFCPYCGSRFLDAS